jgi:hypothetical protein
MGKQGYSGEVLTLSKRIAGIFRNARNRFVAAIRTWNEERMAQPWYQQSSPIDRKRAGSLDKFEDGTMFFAPPEPTLIPIPDRNLTEVEKLVVLAAVHDECCRGVKICPFDKNAPKDLSEAINAIPFLALREKVKELDEQDLVSLGIFVDEIERRPQPELKPERNHGKKFTAEESEKFEKTAAAYLRMNPKATRAMVATYLVVSVGYVSGLSAWKSRNPPRTKTGAKPPATFKRIGMDIALEQTADSHRAEEKDEAECRVQAVDRNDELKRLIRDQDADARADRLISGPS